jgi:hypothetical protein
MRLTAAFLALADRRTGEGWHRRDGERAFEDLACARGECTPLGRSLESARELAAEREHLHTLRLCE